MGPVGQGWRPVRITRNSRMSVAGNLRYLHGCASNGNRQAPVVAPSKTVTPAKTGVTDIW
jgi:hypothetical protein